MLDMKLLRERTEFVRERLATRNAGDEAKVSEVLALDETRRSALAEAEQLKARRNSASKEIGGLIGQKRLEEAEARKAEVRTLGDRIAELDKTAAQAESPCS
jgi:seryl-tRNA synthetase